MAGTGARQRLHMTRTIEQILGLTPMNQFDLVASPMRTLFINTPPPANFLPWTHVPAAVALNTGVTQTPTQSIPTCPGTPALKAQTIPAGSPAVKALRAGWMKKKAEIYGGKQIRPFPARRRFARRAGSTRLHLPRTTTTTKSRSTL
ncbi:MAG TPA: hypothetical protein VMU80_19450 [Bryobacteraceae bacterium]|nr:hypothetical protein [Bryobacteraceae bacterium]